MDKRSPELSQIALYGPALTGAQCGSPVIKQQTNAEQHHHP